MKNYLFFFNLDRYVFKFVSGRTQLSSDKKAAEIVDNWNLIIDKDLKTSASIINYPLSNINYYSSFTFYYLCPTTYWQIM